MCNLQFFIFLLDLYDGGSSAFHNSVAQTCWPFSRRPTVLFPGGPWNGGLCMVSGAGTGGPCMAKGGEGLGLGIGWIPK